MAEDLSPGSIRIETDDFLLYLAREPLEDGISRTFQLETEEFQFFIMNERSDDGIMGSFRIATERFEFGRSWDRDLPVFRPGSDDTPNFVEDFGLFDLG